MWVRCVAAGRIARPTKVVKDHGRQDSSPSVVSTNWLGIPFARQVTLSPRFSRMRRHRNVSSYLLDTTLATDDNWMPARCKIPCNRKTSSVRCCTSVLRYRVKSRTSRISRGGTKLPCSKPHSSNCAIAPSLASVLRPGTFLICAAPAVPRTLLPVPSTRVSNTHRSIPSPRASPATAPASRAVPEDHPSWSPMSRGSLTAFGLHRARGRKP